MEQVLQTTLILLCAAYLNGKSVFHSGTFPYSKCIQTKNGVSCERLNITKGRQEKASLWPPGPYAIPMTRFGCPERHLQGWKKGVLNIKESTGESESQLQFCVKTRHNPTLDNEQWIPGKYNIYKVGNKCPNGFVEFSRTRDFETLFPSEFTPNFTRVAIPASNTSLYTGKTDFHMCAQISTRTSGNWSEYGMLKTEFMLETRGKDGCLQFNGTLTSEESVDATKENSYCIYKPLAVNKSTSLEAVDFHMYTEIISSSEMNSSGKYRVLRQFDMQQNVSVTEIQIEVDGGSTVKNQAEESRLIGCFYDNVMRRYTYGEAVECNIRTTETILHLQIPKNRTGGQIFTLRFEIASKDQIIQPKECFRIFQEAMFEVLDFRMDSKISSEMNYRGTYFVWYSFDVLRFLTVTDIEIDVGSCLKNQTEENREIVYTNKSSTWTSTHWTYPVCKSQTKTNFYIQLQRTVQARYFTLMFEIASGNQILKSKESVRIFLADMPQGDLCNEDIGITYGSIEDFQIMTSSRLEEFFSPAAKPSSVTWCTGESDSTPWILVDLLLVTMLEGVSVWNVAPNRNTTSETNKGCSYFYLYHGTDMSVMTRYNDTEFDLDISKPVSEVQTFILLNPLEVQYVKLEFHDCLGMGSRCIQFELQGCKQLGMLKLNCSNVSKMFEIGADISTERKPMIPNDNRTDERCLESCLSDKNCSIARYEGYCMHYPVGDFGMWQLSERWKGKLYAKLCVEDPIELFPTFYNSDDTITTNLEIINNDAVITSIGYPFTYETGQHYNWLLQFPLHRYIRLVFTNVSLGYMSETCVDTIHISKLIRQNTRSRGIQINHQYNGRGFVFETSESFLFLSFKSCLIQRKVEEKGFQALITGEEIPACLSIDSSIPWSEGRYERCRQLEMILTSMSVLNLPFKNVKEMWRIDPTDKHHSIKLHVIDFYVVCPRGQEHSNVRVTEFRLDGNSYCNTNLPPDDPRPTGESIVIHFYSNKDPWTMVFRTEGFRLRYSQINRSMKSLEDLSTPRKVCSKTFGKCYYLSDKKMGSLAVASEYCLRNNLELVSVHSQYEMQFIEYLVRKKSDTRYIVIPTGLMRRTDTFKKKAFMWNNSSPVTYSNWANKNPVIRYNCVHLDIQANWYSGTCKHSYVWGPVPRAMCQSIMEENESEEKYPKEVVVNQNNCYDVVWRDEFSPFVNCGDYWYERRCRNLHQCVHVERCFMQTCCVLDETGHTYKTQLPVNTNIIHVQVFSIGYDENIPNSSHDKFKCDDGREIPTANRCDGVFHCKDFTDETSCILEGQYLTNRREPQSEHSPPKIKHLLYRCGSNEWISILARCDDVIDCTDASDELDCFMSNTGCDYCNDNGSSPNSQACNFTLGCIKVENEFRERRTCLDDELECKDKRCISLNKRCNGIDDCTDGSDELECESCSEDTFRCDDGKCIPLRLTYDDYTDCNDGSDVTRKKSLTLTSCEQWWEQGYRASREYVIENITVFCDFSSMKTSGIMKMSIRKMDLDLNIDKGLLYTRSLTDTYLQFNDTKLQSIIYRDHYNCNLEVRSSCQFYYAASIIDVNDVDQKCRSTVEKFRAVKHTYRAPVHAHSDRKQEEMTVFMFTRISALPKDGGIYYNVTSVDNITIDDRILRNEIPVQIDSWKITCTYEYKPAAKGVVSCEDDKNTCVYDVDGAGFMTGCHTENYFHSCGNYSCPPQTVKCPGSYCISLRFVCDGTIQCPNGEDEYECTCTSTTREVVILTEYDRDLTESKMAVVKLATQLYTTGSDIRILRYKPSEPLHNKIKFEHRLLTIEEERLNIMKKCQYNTMARNFFGNIILKSNGPKGVIFIEDSTESSKVGQLMFTNLSKPAFVIYRVFEDVAFSLRQNNSQVYKFVKDVSVKNWNTLLSTGYKRFPEICEAATEVPCLGAYRCAASQQCIPVEQVCDGIAQCIFKDDENLCDVICPDKCTCVGYSIYCQGADLNINAVRSMSVATRSADLSRNPNISDALINKTLRFPFMINLNLSSCKIEIVCSDGFFNLKSLQHLDIGHNNIKQLVVNTFRDLTNLVSLNMDGNYQLQDISQSAFHGLKSIKVIRITGTKLKRISSYTFANLTLKAINISYNDITEIEKFAFSNIVVEKIDFRGNDRLNFNKDIFHRISMLQQLFTPLYKFCCIKPSSVKEEDCYPKENELSSCGDLVRYPVLQAVLWLVGLAALFGNTASIIYRLGYDRERLRIGYGIFVTNLAVADLLMGVYLVMIAVADAVFRSRYFYEDEEWRNSYWCVTAGVLSTVSSEASVLFLCLITVDRLLVIKYPFGNVRFRPQTAHLYCVVSWVISVILAVIPVLFTGYFQNKFYSRSGVCVALPLTRDKPPGWIYSVAIFVGLNFCTFILVAFGQLTIFLELRKQTDGMTKTAISRKRDLQVARNLILVATTDFLCWFPIGVMGIMALNDYPIPGEVYAYTVVFILPLNSALNPILYTLTAIVGKQSFNPSTEEQSRTEIQKEKGLSIMQYHELTRDIRVKRDNAQFRRVMCVRDVLVQDRRLSTVTILAIGRHLSRYLCLLHESSMTVDRLSENTVLVKLDKKKRQKVSIVLDAKIAVVDDNKKLQDNIYEFGILLRRLMAK